MKKVNIFLIYFLSFVYMEFLYRFLLYKNVFRLSNINMILFLVPFALLLYFVSKLFKDKGNRVTFYIIMSVMAVWFSAQYVVKSFFDFYISFSVLQIADQLGDYVGKAVIETIKRAGGIILMFLPLILSIIFHKKINFKHNKPVKSLLIGIFIVLASLGYYFGLNIGKNEDYSAYVLYHNVNNPSLNIERVGIINTLCVDSYRAVFGFEEKIIVQPKKKKKDEPVEYKYNNLNIDFNAISENTNDSTIKDMTTYFENESGTLQNEYTGYFKGKNLILFMAESFNEIAVRENTTPTLYKLVNSGFVFDDYYTPTIYSTIGGEFQELTGLYANFSSLSQFRSGSNYFPMGISTLFKSQGYSTFAYHNNSFTFQDRNVYLKNMGFDNFLACRNGMEKLINCNLWPQSDVEMIENTYTDYVNSEEPFMVFYATVSGHSGYTWANAMAKKHKDEFQAFGFNYSEGPSSYMAAQMELDQALELLINKLDEAGKLNDTVIALVGDHYPYELSAAEVNEVASYKKDEVVEINHSNFIFWNNAMKTVHVSKVGSQIDVLPTIYNAFNLPYDSRLIIGKDILSTEEGLAMFANNSWVSDKGTYFTSTGKFVPKDGEEADEEYVTTMNQIVRNKITMSKYIMDKNYYKLAWEHVK